MQTSSLALSASCVLAAAILSGCLPSSPINNTASSSSAASSVASSVSSDITVSTPAPNATVSSPLLIRGEARGTWYFEASFPVKLLDSNGNELAIAPAQAQGEWMTTDFVPYEVTLTFTTNDTSGTLVLQKDNPSGDPARDESIIIPVQF